MQKGSGCHANLCIVDEFRKPPNRVNSLLSYSAFIIPIAPDKEAYGSPNNWRCYAMKNEQWRIIKR